MRRRRLGVAVVVLVALELGGALRSRLAPGPVSLAAPPPGAVVQLRCERLTSVLTPFAVHSYFTFHEPKDAKWRRAEVWAGTPGETGMVRRDLFAADATPISGSAWVEAEWRGEAAAPLLATLATCGERYPWRDEYVFWPGPNCNTFAAWVLKEAGARCELPPQAVGKDWVGLAGASATTEGTGFALDTPLVGLTLGLREGVQVRLFEATFGIHAWPLAVETPAGRIGLDAAPGAPR